MAIPSSPILSTILTISGYDIYMNNIPADKLAMIKKDLSIMPKVCPGYGDENPEPYLLFQEDPATNYIRIPLHYGIKKFGIPLEHHKDKVVNVNMNFASPLRDYQIKIVETFMKSIEGKTAGGGIISVGCGRGKTVMALNIASRINMKTLILVHKEFLANQWRERALQFIPNVRIGTIQGKLFDVQDKDLVIGMIQSLSDVRKDSDYPLEIFKQFGLIIADECHHLGARQFSRVLQKYCIPYTLGLSATPKRNDNCENVFHHYLGDFVYKDSIDAIISGSPDALVHRYEYRYNNMAYCREIKNFKGKPNIINMEGNITKCLKRTKFVVDYIIPELLDAGRKILILSSRLEHIDIIKILLEEKITEQQSINEWTGYGIGLYLGGMKQKDLDISATKQILIATYVMAEEAFDCPTLNTLIMMTPKKNIEQAVGRIMRQKKEDRLIMPLVVDIVDMFSSFHKWNFLRKKFYSKKRYLVETIEVLDDEEIPKFKKNKLIEDYSSGCKLKDNCVLVEEDDEEADDDNLEDENGDNSEQIIKTKSKAKKKPASSKKQQTPNPYEDVEYLMD
jgi:superfamily II DNA or RNA helicase